MRIFAWMLLLLPFFEIYLLIKVGSEVGALTIVLWLFLMVFAGLFCIRSAGMVTAMSVRERMARGEMPETEMMTGMFWVVAGVLLIFPGLITDGVALILLLPATRGLLLRWLQRRHRVVHAQHYRQTQYHQRSDPGEKSRTIEGEFQRRDDEK